VIVAAAKDAVKAAALRLPPLQRALDAHRRRRRLAALDAYVAAGRQLGADRRAAFRSDVEQVCLYTQLGPAGLLNLEMLARRMVAQEQTGAFVECGTWRGGALAFFALSYLRQGGRPERCHIFGFDSFEGMPRMTLADGKGTSRWLYGRELDELDPAHLNGALVGSAVNRASFEECRALMRRTGYPAERLTVVPGWFQETLPAWRERIGPIALLRIDGDFYESTRICFEALYPNVIRGGAVIIDDYGTFEGCRRATDEFLCDQPGLELIEIDFGAAYFIKPS
jgi:O-methyltransferase